MLENPKTIKRESFKTLAAKYGYDDPKLRSFKRLFSEREWKELRAMNPRNRSLTPRQIEFIEKIIGKVD